MEQLEIVEGLIQEKPQVSPVSPADYVTKTEGSKYYGDALNDTNINELVGDEIPHVVILVGFPKYGKSTFVASLYHKVLTTGCVGDYIFVDSDTLAGFERRAQVRDIELKINDRIDRTPCVCRLFSEYALCSFCDQETCKACIVRSFWRELSSICKVRDRYESGYGFKKCSSHHILFRCFKNSI